MPYRRKYGYKRRYKKKSNWYSKAKSGLSMAAKAWAMAKYVKSLVNVERKFYDVTFMNEAPPTTGLIYPLTQIAQGDTYATRDGNSVKAVSLFIRLTAVLNSSADQTFMRLCIFKDNENNGTTPAVADLLESASNYISPLLHTNGTRFSVIKDHTINLTKEINAKQYKSFIRIPHHIKFSGSAGTDTKEGNIYLLLMSDQATNLPVVDFTTRLRFIDN